MVLLNCMLDGYLLANLMCTLTLNLDQKSNYVDSVKKDIHYSFMIVLFSMPSSLKLKSVRIAMQWR